MTSLDSKLAGLRISPSNSVFEGLDAAVIAGLDTRRQQQLARANLSLAVCVAIFVGFGSTMLSTEDVSAQTLNSIPGTAPSKLLID